MLQVGPRARRVVEAHEIPDLEYMHELMLVMSVGMWCFGNQ